MKRNILLMMIVISIGQVVAKVPFYNITQKGLWNQSDVNSSYVLFSDMQDSWGYLGSSNFDLLQSYYARDLQLYFFDTKRDPIPLYSSIGISTGYGLYKLMYYWAGYRLKTKSTQAVRTNSFGAYDYSKLQNGYRNKLSKAMQTEKAGKINFAKQHSSENLGFMLNAWRAYTIYIGPAAPVSLFGVPTGLKEMTQNKKYFFQGTAEGTVGNVYNARGGGKPKRVNVNPNCHSCFVDTGHTIQRLGIMTDDIFANLYNAKPALNALDEMLSDSSLQLKGIDKTPIASISATGTQLNYINHFATAVAAIAGSKRSPFSNVLISNINNDTDETFIIEQNGKQIGLLLPKKNNPVAFYGTAKGDIVFVPQDTSKSKWRVSFKTGKEIKATFSKTDTSTFGLMNDDSAFICAQLTKADFSADAQSEAETLARTQAIDVSKLQGYSQVTLNVSDHIIVNGVLVGQDKLPVYYPSIASIKNCPKLPKMSSLFSGWVANNNISTPLYLPVDLQKTELQEWVNFINLENVLKLSDFAEFDINYEKYIKYSASRKVIAPENNGSKNYLEPLNQSEKGNYVSAMFGTNLLFTSDIPKKSGLKKKKPVLASSKKGNRKVVASKPSMKMLGTTTASKPPAAILKKSAPKKSIASDQSSASDYQKQIAVLKAQLAESKNVVKNLTSTQKVASDAKSTGLLSVSTVVA